MRTQTTFPVALVCAAALTAGCSTEPLTEKEIAQLESLGPGLQRVGKGLAEVGETLADGMCRLGRGFARGQDKEDFARHCPARRRDSGRGTRR